jgi:hypothetical protein
MEDLKAPAMEQAMEDLKALAMEQAREDSKALVTVQGSALHWGSDSGAN